MRVTAGFCMRKQLLGGMQNRASCRGLQENDRGKAASRFPNQAPVCLLRRHILVPERSGVNVVSIWKESGARCRRSEERRVGKECRCRWWRWREKQREDDITP